MERFLDVVRRPSTRMALVIVVAWSGRASPAVGQCAAPTAPAPRAYQSGATTVEIVVPGSNLAGADHWEVSRSKAGGPTISLLPASIPTATTSITDDGQGLESGATYSYQVTVQNAGGTRTSYPTAVVDVGNQPPLPLGSSVVLADYFGVDPSNGQRINWWFMGFPSPIGRLYAKQLETARSPASGAALPCAQVTVRLSGESTPAPLYADRWGRFSLPNPLTADRHGRFEFYADNGLYDLAVVAGAINYTRSSVAVFDARAAQIAHSSASAPALTLTSGEAPGAAPDGNVYLKFTRPHSSDGNDRPIPYRLLGLQLENAWALTYNLGIDEATNALSLDDATMPAFFFRVHRPSAALEFAIDPGYGAVDQGPWLAREPAPETLLHAGPDRVHFKSFLGPIGIAATAAKAGLHAGDVVTLRANGTALKTSRPRTLNPFTVLGVDEPNGVSRVRSRIYLAVGGRCYVHVVGNVSVNDPLISTADGSAQAASSETDTRYIVGYAREAFSGGPSAVANIPANVW
jgi:hypothetical protein